jgi:hypothetical protein
MQQLSNFLINDLEELSLKSLGILQHQVINYFNEIGLSVVWFIDIDKELPEKFSSENNIEVVFFGGFLERCTELKSWPDKHFRLWCLSSAVKDILVKLIGFSDTSLKVIPRYKLFAAPKTVRKWPKLDSEFSFIYAGRISAHKNLECLLYTVFYLQIHFGLKAKLYLMGKDDNLTHRYRPLCVLGSYKMKILTLINRLPWLDRPEYLGELKENEWSQKDYKNPVFVNFSTYLCEDFSVSVAQAQEQGWPVVLSNWGGLKDVKGDVLFIPAQMISTTFDSHEIEKKKSKELASFIFHNLSKPHFAEYPQAKPELLHDFLEISEIFKIASEFELKLGKGFKLIQEKKMEQCFIEKNGFEFLQGLSFCNWRHRLQYRTKKLPH